MKRAYLYSLRKQAHLSQAAVATQMGVSPTYYTSIENADRQKDMAFSIMQKLAQTFGTSVEQIMELETEYQQSQDKTKSDKTA